MGIEKDLVEALDVSGISKPFEIQKITIPDILKGRDVCGKAKTGSGKTIAFGLPIVQLLQRSKPGKPTGLALVPTRELAVQVCKEIDPLASKRKLRVKAIYGGSPIEKQIESLKKGVDFVVATPGRLIDLLERGDISLIYVEKIVID